MARIKVDLHDIYKNSATIDNALLKAFEEAIEKKYVKWRSFRQRKQAIAQKSRTLFTTAVY
jgi:hypothetical protein